jgi:hypothetical protein
LLSDDLTRRVRVLAVTPRARLAQALAGCSGVTVHEDVPIELDAYVAFDSGVRVTVPPAPRIGPDSHPSVASLVLGTLRRRDLNLRGIVRVVAEAQRPHLVGTEPRPRPLSSFVVASRVGVSNGLVRGVVAEGRIGTALGERALRSLVSSDTRFVGTVQQRVEGDTGTLLRVRTPCAGVFAVVVHPSAARAMREPLDVSEDALVPAPEEARVEASERFGAVEDVFSVRGR